MTKYQREQITLAISDQLEIITEQFIMASQNKGAIPLIEIDLLKESVRTLYQQINDWQSTNEVVSVPAQAEEEKSIIVTKPIEEPVMTTQPTEALFNDATVSVEVSEPVLEIVAEEPIVEETIIEEPTIKEFIAEEPIQVVAEAPSTTSEGFLSRILKAKPAEKTSEVKQEVTPKQEVKTVTAQVAEQPVAKPALQVSRTVYPDADTTTGNRFKGQETIYDRLRQQSNPTVADRLSAKPVGDLKKSIGINERFTLINELFGGNQQLFMESIDKINNVNAYEEARKVLYEELAGNLKWNTEGNTFHVLDELVKRRFNG
ncbi:MAG: hypothetical protein ACK5B3_05415 [Bacteroidota bacterium]|jgi:hypothetical protein